MLPPLPENIQPVPAGYLIIGTAPRERDMGSVRSIRWLGDGWTPPSGYALTSDFAYYAIPADSPQELLAEFQQRIEFYNPRPMEMESPVPIQYSLHRDGIPHGLPRLPPGYLLIGITPHDHPGQFATIPCIVWNNGIVGNDGEWSQLARRRMNSPACWYAIPDWLPNLEDYRHRILIYHPDFFDQPRFTITPSPMFDPIPANLPPIPDDAFLIGRTSRDLPESVSQTFECQELDDGTIGIWRSVRSSACREPRFWICVTTRTPVRDLPGLADRIRFYNPLTAHLLLGPEPALETDPAADTVEAMTIQPLRASYELAHASMPQVPEGWLLLGYRPDFNTNTPSTRRFNCRLWMIGDSTWSRPSNSSMGSPFWYIIPQNAPVTALQEFQHRIRHYNPTFLFPAAEAELPAPQQIFDTTPTAIPQIPIGSVLIGGGILDATELIVHGWFWRAGQRNWDGALSIELCHEDQWYCLSLAEADPAVLDRFRDRITFYNPETAAILWPVENRQEFPPAPANMPEIPEGYRLIGYQPGTEFARAESRLWSEHRLDWSSESNFFTNTNAWFCVAEDSPAAEHYADRIRFYHPPLPEPEPVRVVIPPSPAAAVVVPDVVFAPITRAPIHSLVFNGVPVSSQEELSRIVFPLLEDPDKLVAVVSAAWSALGYEEPENIVLPLLEHEPVIIGSLEFIRRPQTMPAPVVVSASQIIEREPTQLEDRVVRAAAGALLANGMSDHFQFTENRALVINPENPPTIDQAYEMVGRIFETRETGHRLENFSSWTLGMVMDECERFFGNDFDVSQVCEQSTKAYNTAMCALGTFRAFGSNRRDLSFTHHKEAYYSRTTPAEMEAVLDMSVKHRLTVKEQRTVSSFIKAHGLGPLQDQDITDKETLLSRLAMRAVNKNWMFLFQGDWRIYRGPYEAIPNGASPIFNTDTRQRYDLNPEQPQLLQSWETLGRIIDGERGHAATLNANREVARQTGDEVARSTGGNHGLAAAIGLGEAVPTADEVAVPDEVEEPVLDEVDEPAETINAPRARRMTTFGVDYVDNGTGNVLVEENTATAEDPQTVEEFDF